MEKPGTAVDAPLNVDFTCNTVKEIAHCQQNGKVLQHESDTTMIMNHMFSNTCNKNYAKYELQYAKIIIHYILLEKSI